MNYPLKLKLLRVEKGWTQKQLATKAKVAVPVLSELENGTVRNLKPLERIANALGKKVKIEVD